MVQRVTQGLGYVADWADHPSVTGSQCVMLTGVPLQMHNSSVTRRQMASGMLIYAYLVAIFTLSARPW